MAYWLLKTEPSDYSAGDLKRDKRTSWTGVKNAAAQKNLRAMTKGDLAIIYHTGDERRCVAIAQIAKPPYVDPKGDGKMVAVELQFRSMLKTPVTLDEIKSDKAFTGWDLLRIGRLSVVPTSDVFWNRLMELSTMPAEK